MVQLHHTPDKPVPPRSMYSKATSYMTLKMS